MSNEKNTPILPSSTSTLNGLSQLIATSHANETDNSLVPKLTTEHKIPPLEKWQPKFCGDMDLTIKANGEWWHEGQQVTRQSLVDLFASVIWAETDEQGDTTYFLKTPVEKLKIQVEDAPLLVTQVDSIEKNGKTYLEFTTPHGDKVIADNEHPITLEQPNSATDDSTAPQPYILVRQNGDSKLYALIHRNVFYHLLNMGELSQTSVDTGEQTCLTLKSGDCVFSLSVPNN